MLADFGFLLVAGPESANSGVELGGWLSGEVRKLALHLRAGRLNFIETPKDLCPRGIIRCQSRACNLRCLAFDVYQSQVCAR